MGEWGNLRTRGRVWKLIFEQPRSINPWIVGKLTLACKVVAVLDSIWWFLFSMYLRTNFYIKFSFVEYLSFLSINPCTRDDRIVRFDFDSKFLYQVFLLSNSLAFKVILKFNFFVNVYLFYNCTIILLPHVIKRIVELEEGNIVSIPVQELTIEPSINFSNWHAALNCKHGNIFQRVEFSINCNNTYSKYSLLICTLNKSEFVKINLIDETRHRSTSRNLSMTKQRGNKVDGGTDGRGSIKHH